jgi:hypothetical protein
MIFDKLLHSEILQTASILLNMAGRGSKPTGQIKESFGAIYLVAD